MTEPVLARLIVPLDTSPLAESVLPWAGLVARDHAMELHLVAVWDVNEPIPGFHESTDEGALEGLRRYLDDVAAKAAVRDVPVTLEAAAGDVVDEIVRVAHERPGSMVLLCSHGHGGYREAYVGSVAERLVRHAGVPVLVIPASP